VTDGEGKFFLPCNITNLYSVSV